MAGILYGVGVGPGDPELMTLKACRVIKENEVIAVPGKSVLESVAYRIAVQAVPDIEKKTVIPLPFPMVTDTKRLEKSHRDAAKRLEAFMDQGKNVVFLTLGDVAVYSTFSYVQRMVSEDGYETRMISGVASFCAAAATLGCSLAEGEQPVRIIPAARHFRPEELEKEPGSYVLMKAGRRLSSIKKQLLEKGIQAQMVENCGLQDQKIYRSVENFPEEAGYFSLIIAKVKETGRETKET